MKKFISTVILLIFLYLPYIAQTEQIISVLSEHDSEIVVLHLCEGVILRTNYDPSTQVYWVTLKGQDGDIRYIAVPLYIDVSIDDSISGSDESCPPPGPCPWWNPFC